ncbi:MAG: glycosyltransferase family 2 protein [Bacteroidia bacterium]
MNLIYAITVNYNQVADTVLCIKSLLNQKPEKPKIILVDNGSELNIVEELQKQINLISNDIWFVEADSEFNYSIKQHYDIIFIKSAKNLGFAGGNNLAIKFIREELKQQQSDFWLINNDAYADENALKQITDEAYTRNLAITGAVVYNTNSSQIQSVGGIIHPRFAVSINCNQLTDIPKIEYVYGASFFIHCSTIDKIGYLPEHYFMYFEETDYCFTARKQGLKIGVAQHAKVYHKPSAKYVNKKTDLMQQRNKIWFAKKFGYPMFWVKLGLLLTVFNRIIRLQLNRVPYILSLIFS